MARTPTHQPRADTTAPQPPAGEASSQGRTHAQIAWKPASKIESKIEGKPVDQPARSPQHQSPTQDADLAFARAIIREESDALQTLAGSLGHEFSRAVDLLVACAESGGTVIVSGLGKSGLVGAKISATMASLGIPSHSVHPSEAAHGDLGRFRPSDVVICISCSGETDEVVNLAAILRQDGVKIVSITCGVAQPQGQPPRASSSQLSSIERLATVALTLGGVQEAGSPEFVAPTSTTTATLALGDALALVAARRRNFTRKDFAKRHPGGALGGLLRPVVDVMRWRAGKNLPLVRSSLSVLDALREADKAGRRPGALMIVDDAGKLAGIFTDGDLRRLVQQDKAGVDRPIATCMTRTPRTLRDDACVGDAVKLIREFRQDEVPIINSEGKPVGILDVQDLIALRLVEE